MSTFSAVRIPFAAIVLAMLPAVLDQTILATALPTIAGSLGELSDVSWVVTAYVVAAAATTPLWGKLGDRLEKWERRRKTARLARRKPAPAPEVVLSSEQCKGHFDLHRERALRNYVERLADVGDADVHLLHVEHPSPREAV